MKNTTRLLFSAVLLLVLALPAFSQGRPGSGSSDRGSAPSSGGVSTSSSVSSTSSVGSYSSRGESSRGGFDAGGIGFGGASSGRRGGAYAPPVKLEGSSFTTMDTYYRWQDFYWFLQTRYMMNGLYFTRFYRNREPLVTPDLLRRVVRQPYRLSMQMLTAIDELETLLQDRAAGKPVDKQVLAAKAQEIRELAKRIRTDEALAFVDQRKEKDILKGNNIEALGLESINQLREMATDLNSQLKNMYTQNTTSTVSVNSLTQPSLDSLSRGIEKISKAIENSAKKI